MICFITNQIGKAAGELLRFSLLRMLCLSAWMLIPNLRAQNFGLSVSNSPNPAVLGATLTYTINVTNLNLATVVLGEIAVTNTLPDSVQFISATNNIGTYSTNGQDVIFIITDFAIGAFAHITINAVPQSVGTITNIVTVTAIGPVVVTNEVNTLVTTVVSGQSDLGISIAGPATRTLVNDWTTFTLTATNEGPGNVSNVLLTSTLPTNLFLISVQPTNQSFSVSNNNLLFNLGTMTNHSSVELQVTVQPATKGIFPISASIKSPGLLDPNSGNDNTSFNLAVHSFLAGELAVTSLGTAQYNPQTGLMEQTVRVTNIGTNPVGSARVFVAGLGTNLLYNSVGINDTNPYVLYSGTLQTNQSVDLLLEFFVWTRLPLNGLSFSALEVPAASPTSPPAALLNITLVTNVPSGLLIEFPATLGRSYTIFYSDTATFTNALAAHPSVIAPGDRVQWIDSGPPKTLSAPSNTTSRYYRVQLNP